MGWVARRKTGLRLCFCMLIDDVPQTAVHNQCEAPAPGDKIHLLIHKGSTVTTDKRRNIDRRVVVIYA